jgi:transposase-like protein
MLAGAPEPGMSIPYVARGHGISPSLVFGWGRRMSEGGKEAVRVDDEVVASLQSNGMAEAFVKTLWAAAVPRGNRQTIIRRRDTSRRGNALSRRRLAARGALQRVGSSEAAIAFAEGRRGAAC